MGALIKLLESSNWSLCGANTSLTKTPFQQNIKTWRLVISQGEIEHIRLTLLDCSMVPFGAQ